MKLFLALSCFCCTLLLATFPHHASAQYAVAEDCDSYPDIPINVIARFDDPKYDFTQNISSIMGMAGAEHDFIHDGFALGLTRYQPFIDINLATRVINMPNGLTCAKADHVDVTIGYKDLTVYVANEVPQQSCGFNQIMDHERAHLEINRQLLEKYRPIIQNQVGGYLKLNGLFREPNYDYAIGLVHDKVKDILGHISEDFNRDNAMLHTQWDTQEEARMNLSCHGELITIIQDHHILNRE